MSTADKLQRFSIARSNTTKSIKNKGVDATCHGFEAFPSDIDRISTGGGSSTSAKDADVRFIDYDGTIVHGYTADEFLELSEMPENPTHEGLVSQGWNWTLADAQACVTEYGMLDIAQMYITDDGKTRLYIGVDQLLWNDVHIYFSQSVNRGVTVNWGDGSAEETFTGTGGITTAHHVYTNTGDYCITLDAADGCTLGIGSPSDASFSVMGKNSRDDVFFAMLYAAEIGARTVINQSAFISCYSLKTVSIPDSVMSIGNKAFSNCSGLTGLTVPSGVTSLPASVIYGCSCLKCFSMPAGVTTISDSALSDCRGLTHLSIPGATTTIGAYALSNCPGIKKIAMPRSMTSIGRDALSFLASLTTFTIPDGVEAIPYSLFSACYSLSQVIIPSSATSIDIRAFANCRSMAEIRFKGSTPPTVSSSTAFSGVPPCKIYVPAGSLAAYTSATNYPSSSTYTYVEY